MRYALLLLALALAGCNSFGQSPMAYQTPSGPAWQQDCKKGYCRLELHTSMQGGDSVGVYAGYNGDELIVGFETPPGTGAPLMLVDDASIKPTTDLGCTQTRCQAGWVLTQDDQRRLLSAQKLAFQDTQSGNKVELDAGTFGRALEALR